MNWKVKMVLLFAKLRKPIEPSNDVDIKVLHKQADSAARLGSILFNDKINITTRNNFV